MVNHNFYEGPRFDLPGATPVPGLENRPSYLPRLFIVDQHVQHPYHNFGTIYVYLEDTKDADRMRQMRKFTKGLKIPSGSKEYLTKECGLLHAEDGDVLFARPIGGDTQGADDSLQLMAFGKRWITVPVVERLLNFRKNILGPDGQIKPDDATEGTAFERAGHCKGIGAGTRAYNLAVSLERQTLVSAPAGQGKGSVGELAEGVELRQGAIKHSTEVGMYFADMLPGRWKDVVSKQSDLVNAPRIGVENNLMFGNVQMNIASAKRKEADNRLSSLGFFGGAHIDKGDSEGALTEMIACNNIPEDGYHGGFFHLIELGVFVTLEAFNCLFFSGLRLHGGTAPICTDDMLWVDWATRLVFVLYPPRHILNNFSITALASVDVRLRNAEQEHQARLADRKLAKEREGADSDTEGEEELADVIYEEGKEFKVNYPNMLKFPSSIKNNPQNPHVQPLENHATFAQDGHIIMPRHAWITFVVRNIYLMNIGLLCQLGTNSGLRVDPVAFLKSFSVCGDNNYGVTEEDIRRVLDEWKYAPHLNDFEADTPRREAAQEWQYWVAHTSSFIPSTYKSLPGESLSIATSEFTPESGLIKNNCYESQLKKQKEGRRGQKRSNKSKSKKGTRKSSKDESSKEDTDEEEDETEDDEDLGQDGVEEEDGSEDEEVPLSAVEKEVIRRTIRRTVTVVAADFNVGYRATRRSTRLKAEDYEPDFVSVTDTLYTSDDPYAVVLATSNRLNNLLIRLEDEDTILEDLCRIFRELFIPTKSWFSAESISRQLISYQQSISYTDDSPPASFDWVLVLRRHVIPFWCRVNQRNGTWLSTETLMSASLSMRAVKHLTGEIHATYALVRSTRYHILMSHCFAWSWLESVCAYHSQPHIAQNALSSSWPCKLARYLYMVIQTRLPTFTLCPSDFIPHLSSESQTFRTIGFKEFSITECVPVLQQRVYLQMKRVLQQWLDFPQDDIADSQAWLVQNFVGVFGSGSLLLDETWDIYQHVSKHVLGRSRKQTRTIFLHQIVPFFYHIKHCDAAVKNSAARTLLDRYHEEHKMYGSGRGQDAAATHSSSLEVIDSFQGQLQDKGGNAGCVEKPVESDEEDMYVDTEMHSSVSGETGVLVQQDHDQNSNPVFPHIESHYFWPDKTPSPQSDYNEDEADTTPLPSDNHSTFRSVPSVSQSSKRLLEDDRSHSKPSNKRVKFVPSAVVIQTLLSPPSPSLSSPAYPSRISLSRMHHALGVLRKLSFFLRYQYPNPNIEGSRYVGTFEGQPAEDVKLLKVVATDLDGYLPFPRCAPSVLHAMSSTGLSGRDFDQSLLFSAISFRAVFFKSLYHFDHPTYLQDFDDYKNRVLDIHQPDYPSSIVTPGVKTSEYWANPNQYSNGAHMPSVDNISIYWSSVNLEWCYPPHKVFKCYNARNPPPLHRPTPLPFDSFSKDYLCFNRQSPATGNKVNLFPNLGGLIGYLCALDLSYAGYVEKPSFDDVVEAMVKVNSGGVRGLVALGLLERKEKKHKHSITDIEDAFSVFHNFLDNHLTRQEKEAMVFDCPMSEHFSCKLSKFVRLGFVVFPDDDSYKACTCCA